MVRLPLAIVYPIRFATLREGAKAFTQQLDKLKFEHSDSSFTENLPEYYETFIAPGKKICYDG
jgi:hypothetical protein